MQPGGHSAHRSEAPQQNGHTLLVRPTPSPATHSTVHVVNADATNFRPTAVRAGVKHPCNWAHTARPAHTLTGHPLHCPCGECRCDQLSSHRSARRGEAPQQNGHTLLVRPTPSPATLPTVHVLNAPPPLPMRCYLPARRPPAHPHMHMFVAPPLRLCSGNLSQPRPTGLHVGTELNRYDTAPSCVQQHSFATDKHGYT